MASDHTRRISSLQNKEIHYGVAEQQVLIACQQAATRFFEEFNAEGARFALDVIDKYLCDPDVDYSGQMYFWIKHLLHEIWPRRVTWEWLRERAAKMKEFHERLSLLYGVFGWMAMNSWRDLRTDPYIRDDFENLLCLVHNQDTAWATFWAFDQFNHECYAYGKFRFPQNLQRAFTDYQKRQWKEGLTVPSFPRDLLTEYIDWSKRFNWHTGLLES